MLQFRLLTSSTLCAVLALAAGTGSVEANEADTSSSLAPIRLTEDFRLWVPTFAQIPVYKRLKLITEASPRIGNDVTKLNQLLLRQQLLYRVNQSVDISAGYVYNRVYVPLRYEHRIFEELRLRHRFKHFGLVGRTRLEQRFIQDAEGCSSRARQQIRLAYPIPRTHLEALVTDELFVNLYTIPGGPVRGLDENRFFAGISFPLPRKTSRIEVGYLQQYINRDIQPDQLNQILFIGAFADI